MNKPKYVDQQYIRVLPNGVTREAIPVIADRDHWRNVAERMAGEIAGRRNAEASRDGVPVDEWCQVSDILAEFSKEETGCTCCHTNGNYCEKHPREKK